MMMVVYLLLGAAAAFFAVIALIVLGQEVSALLAIGVFMAILYGCWKLFQYRITRF